MHYAAGTPPSGLPPKLPLRLLEHSALRHPSSPAADAIRVLRVEVSGAPARVCATCGDGEYFPTMTGAPTNGGEYLASDAGAPTGKEYFASQTGRPTDGLERVASEARRAGGEYFPTKIGSLTGVEYFAGEAGRPTDDEEYSSTKAGRLPDGEYFSTKAGKPTSEEHSSSEAGRPADAGEDFPTKPGRPTGGEFSFGQAGKHAGGEYIPTVMGAPTADAGEYFASDAGAPTVGKSYFASQTGRATDGGQYAASEARPADGQYSPTKAGRSAPWAAAAHSVELPAAPLEEEDLYAALGERARTAGLVHFDSLRPGGFSFALQPGKRADDWVETLKPLGGGWCCVATPDRSPGHF